MAKKSGQMAKSGHKSGQRNLGDFGRNSVKIGPIWAILGHFTMFTDEFCGEKMVRGQKPTFSLYYYKEKIKNIYN